MYGTETNETGVPIATEFENDVKMYGTETSADKLSNERSLRMM